MAEHSVDSMATRRAGRLVVRTGETTAGSKDTYSVAYLAEKSAEQ